MIKRHYSEILLGPDALEEHQKNVDFLAEQAQRVDEYPYAVQIVFKYARQLLEEHVALYPDDQAQAFNYLRLISRSANYLMRLHFLPDDTCTGYWLDTQASFTLRQGERKTKFNSGDWYHGIVAAVLLRDGAQIRQLCADHQILQTLERDLSPRDDHQFEALFYEIWLYYLTDKYGVDKGVYVEEEDDDECDDEDEVDYLEPEHNREVMAVRLENILNYAVTLSERYQLAKPLAQTRFSKRPKGKQADAYYYHYYCHRMIPCLQALAALWRHDEAGFAAAYEQGVMMHQRYWERETEHDGYWEEQGYYLSNDHIGFLSLTLTALAALAHDQGFVLPVQTEYCPDFLIQGITSTHND